MFLCLLYLYFMFILLIIINILHIRIISNVFKIKGDIHEFFFI